MEIKARYSRFLNTKMYILNVPVLSLKLKKIPKQNGRLKELLPRRSDLKQNVALTSSNSYIITTKNTFSNLTNY